MGPLRNIVRHEVEDESDIVTPVAGGRWPVPGARSLSAGFDLLVDEPNELFKQIQELRIGDLANLANDRAASFDDVRVVLDANLVENASRKLAVEEFLDFVRLELSGAILVPFEPADEPGQRGPLVEQFQRLFVRRRLAVHSCDKPFQRLVAKFTDSKPQ